MWVKLQFDIGSVVKDPFESAEQSAHHTPDPDAVCLTSRLLCVLGRRDKRKTRGNLHRRARGE
jgi:hypothetical protein